MLNQCLLPLQLTIPTPPENPFLFISVRARIKCITDHLFALILGSFDVLNNLRLKVSAWD